MGHELEMKKKKIRAARLDILKRHADVLSKHLAELGPCHAVTVAFTVPDEDEDQVGTYAFTGFFDPNMGSLHYAKVSDLMNAYHVELQAKLDKDELERRTAEAAADNDPPGVVVTHEKEATDEPS